MRKDRTELTAVVLDGPDKLQHLFWRYVDPELAETIPDSEQHITDLCIGFYRRLDDNIRRLMEAAGPDTDVIFTSDHGFGPTTEIFYVNEWLSRHGYLKWSDAARGDKLGQLAAEKLKDHLGMIDWKATKAFSPTPSSNAIFIKKDLGSGLGVKEEEYLPFVLKLQRELLEFRDPADGQPVVVGADLNKLRGANFRRALPGHHAAPARRRLRVDPQIERGAGAAPGSGRHSPSGRDLHRPRPELRQGREACSPRYSRCGAADAEPAWRAGSGRPRGPGADRGAARRAGGLAGQRHQGSGAATRRLGPSRARRSARR